MALTGMLLQRDGWENQAAHLSLTHTAVGKAAVAVAEQMGQRRAPQWPRSRSEMVAAEIESQPPTANSDYANELEAMRARMIELQEQVARKTAAARILDAHMKTLAGQAASAQERIADLEIELGSTQEALAQQENENCSLQSSLDLMVAENARLSRRLLEECTACDTVSSRLERVNSTLTATDAERDKLIAAVAEADKKRQSETEDLQTRLKAAAARAVAAETLLAEAQQTLAVCAEEKNTAERAAVSATLARNLAENEFKSLQASLQTKEQEVLETATVALEADGRLERIAAELQGTRDRIGGCERENPSSERPPDGGGNESLSAPGKDATAAIPAGRRFHAPAFCCRHRHKGGSDERPTGT